MFWSPVNGRHLNHIGIHIYPYNFTIDKNQIALHKYNTIYLFILVLSYDVWNFND